MKIAVDVRILHPNMGMGVYLWNLLKNLKRFSEMKFYLISDDDVPNEFSEHAEDVLTVSGIGKKCFEKYWAPYELERIGADVYFNPKNTGSISSCVPQVLTVHDVIPVFFKGFDNGFFYKEFYKSMEKADKIITVSKKSKSDILKFFPEFSKKVSVVYSGIDDVFFVKKDDNKVFEVRDKFGIKDRYFLYVGNFAHQKNFMLALKSLFLIKKSDGFEDVKLVAVGAVRTLGEKERFFIKEKGLEKDVIFIDGVDRNLLPYLYDGAECLFFPSLYEGFGFPVVEAASRKLPVVAYPNDVFREEFGGVVFFAENENEWVEQVVYILSGNIRSDSDFLKKCSHIEMSYNFENTASETKKIFEFVGRKKADFVKRKFLKFYYLLGKKFCGKKLFELCRTNCLKDSRLIVFLTARENDLEKFLSSNYAKYAKDILIVSKKDLNGGYANVKILDWGSFFSPKKKEDEIKKIYDSFPAEKVVFIWNNNTGEGYEKIYKEMIVILDGCSFYGFDGMGRLWKAEFPETFRTLVFKREKKE